MSVTIADRPPMGDSPARAAAKETLWRLTALALAHPAPEFHQTLVSGRFQEAFAAAWAAVEGRGWPRPAATGAFAEVEAGYIAAFLHGPKGRPVASLLAGDHEPVLAGLTRPVFMLNIAAFYKHFGLKAATGDEGRQDEPDHLASMTEFMAVLSHLEAAALAEGRDPAPCRRAQRDFLRRYLQPTLAAVAGRLRRDGPADLDPTVMQVVQDMAAWSDRQAAELEARVGPFRGPDAPKAAWSPDPETDTATQNLWG